MKKPNRIIFRPYAIYHPPQIDAEQLPKDSLLLYIPSFVVRAYRMQNIGSLQGKIWIDITDEHRSLNAFEYWWENVEIEMDMDTKKLCKMAWDAAREMRR